MVCACPDRHHDSVAKNELQRSVFFVLKILVSWMKEFLMSIVLSFKNGTVCSQKQSRPCHNVVGRLG